MSVEEGQRVRDYMQSLVRGPVEEFWPKVMISYATGTRDLKRGYECDLDGDGCGPGTDGGSNATLPCRTAIEWTATVLPHASCRCTESRGQTPPPSHDIDASDQ